MNFIRYNPETGGLTSTGYMDDVHVQAEIDSGLPTLFADNIMDISSWRVNLTTKQLEPKE
jgi:hypothetical protein